MIFQNRSPSQGVVIPTDILGLNTPGSLVIDLGAEKLYSSDGNTAFEIGANLDSQHISNEVSVGNSSVNVVINSSAISVSGVALGRGYTGSSGVGYTGSGATGFTGSPGITAGATGFTGSPGTPGGYTGSQGDQGDQGNLGFTGSPGIPGGYTGSPGDQGNQGNFGYTGSPGAGFTGSPGSGFVGSPGFTGSPGIPGGYTGSPGEDGIDGFTGSQGFVGSKGDTGTSGSQGFTGSIGSPGGFTGSPGPTGFTGSVGATGAGFTGSKGDTGSQGVIGFTGSGATGFTGSGGFTGSRGTTGFTGSLGTTGFTGSGGFTGSQGSLGFTGSLGTTGFTGSGGFTGSQGSLGFTGSQGTQGIQGYTGSVNFTATQLGNATNIQPPPILMGAANTDWLTDFVYTYPYGPYVWMVSPRGSGSLLTATRTMDWNANTSEALDIFNQFSIVVHDNPLNPGFVAGSAGYQGLWNHYWQLTRTANAYGNVNMQILEASLANYGNEIPGDPYNATTPGQCAVATFDSGLGLADANLKSVTVALNILANSKDFLAGIKYGCNALRAWNGYYQAIQLASAPLDGGANGHSLVWFSGSNTISGHIEVNKSNNLIIETSNTIYLLSDFHTVFVGNNTSVTATASVPCLAFDSYYSNLAGSHFKLDLFDGQYGLGISSGSFDYQSGLNHTWYVGGDPTHSGTVVASANTTTFRSLPSVAPSATAMLPISYSSVAGLGIYVGTGSPTVLAPNGSLYIETNSGGALWFMQSSSWTQVNIP